LDFLDRFFVEVLKIKFYKNPSPGRRAYTNGQIDERTYMTKLIAAFRNLWECS